MVWLDGNSRPQTAPTDMKKDDKYPADSEETDEGRRKGSESQKGYIIMGILMSYKSTVSQ